VRSSFARQGQLGKERQHGIRSLSDQHQGDPGARCIGFRAIGSPPSILGCNSMSAHQRSISPPAHSSRQNRSSHHRDRADRDRRRERDGGHHEWDRRDRDDRGFDRRDRNSDSKRGGRRSASPPSRSSRKPRDSRSKSPSSRRRRSRSRSRSRSRRPDVEEGGEKDKEEDKAKPNFGSSGLLAAATKTVKTGDGQDVVLKYHEPPEARKPLLGWRLYVFKGSEQVGVLSLSLSASWN